MLDRAIALGLELAVCYLLVVAIVLWLTRPAR
jgi:hypothetical protein